MRLERALEREKGQKEPKYKELCRRFLADEEDFKEENLVRCGIDRRYRNDDLRVCLEEICRDLKAVMEQGGGQQGVSCPHLPIFTDVCRCSEVCLDIGVWSLEIGERENGWVFLLFFSDKLWGCSGA